MFLCHFPSPARLRRAEAWALPSTLSGGARTFLPEAFKPRGDHPASPAFSYCEASIGQNKGQESVFAAEEYAYV